MVGEQTHSPVQNTTQSPKAEVKVTEGEILMDFPDAIKAIIRGSRVTRIEWDNKNIYGFLNGDVLSLHKEDGKNHQWIVNDGDLKSEDWILS